jgi:GntR family transcriptional regulator
VSPVPDSPAPFRRLADEIKAKILSGELQPGERLPTVRTMQVTYSLSRATIGRALDALEAEGLVRAYPGSGVYVRAPEDVSLAELVARVDELERRTADLERWRQETENRRSPD